MYSGSRYSESERPVTAQVVVLNWRIESDELSRLISALQTIAMTITMIMKIIPL